MTRTDEQLAEYVIVYTIAPLPDVKDEDFEKHILENASFSLTSRPLGIFDLEHRFLKRRSDGHADRYVWQIRVLSVEWVGGATEDDMFAKLDDTVRRRLQGIGAAQISFGIPVSRTILQEIGAAQTR